MSELAYNNLPVGVQRKDDFYEVGFTLHGRFFAFGKFNAGGFDADVNEAQVAEQAAQDDANRQAAQQAAAQANTGE